MGVQGLESYVKDFVPNGFAPIKILDEIEKFKSAESSKPVIIFDVMGFIHSLGGNQIELLCGGRHNIYLKKVRKFFESLTNHGAELIFICDGHVSSDNLSKWIGRRRKEYVDCLNTFDNIENGHKSTSFTSYGRCCKSVTHSIRLCAAEFGKVIICNGYNCDAMIAKYAIEHKALAVVATDTDFLMYAGNWRYWQAMSISFEDLTIIQFNRNALLKHLNLSREQMPLFATIVGNDYKEDLRYQKQFGGSKRERFSKIAGYVRDIQVNGKKCDSSFYEKLYSDLFGGKLNTVVAKDKIEKLTSSIDSYNVHFEILQDEIESPVRKYAEENVFINSVLSDGIFQYEVNFIDLRDAFNNNVSVSFMDAILIAYRKLSGIILFDFPDRKFSMLTKRAWREPYQLKQEKPIWPTETIPTLNLLISNNKEIEDIKWNLLMWSLSIEEDFQYKLKNISNDFIISVLAITFLLKNEQIMLLEADALMTVEFDVKNKSYDENAIVQPELLNGRAVRVSHMYNKAVCLVWNCLFICGLKEIIVPFKFDGFYFHNTLEQFQISPDAHSDAVQNIQNIRIYGESSKA